VHGAPRQRENEVSEAPAGLETPAAAAWLADLERRHLADLSRAEVARGLRALSGLYVERRNRLGEGAALEGTGKRAAFALFYAPVHFVIVRSVLAALPPPPAPVTRIVDLGCGTGVAGAAWALHAGGQAMVTGIDRHPWAAGEAAATYRAFGLRGGVRTGDVSRLALPARAGTAMVAAYAVNELAGDARDRFLAHLETALSAGSPVLVVEPIARRQLSWWPAWTSAFAAHGGREDEWRMAAALPPLQRELARAAGLDPRELTARTLYAAPPPAARARTRERR
jgi:hypothetical protein